MQLEGQLRAILKVKKILVVDDEPAILRFVKSSLTLAGYDVVATTSGEEALQLTRSEGPDIILLDIFMAPVSGFDVLAELRTFSRIPVIVFTARSHVAKQAFELGANGFLTKPFKLDELQSKIDDILGPNGHEPSMR